nr:sigma-70 family RNA polymerase sigma factor [Microbacterium barkeri]
MTDQHADAERERDADLLARTRTGDQHAYAELWERYAPAASAVARSYWWSTDPDDLVAESFTRIYQAIQAGKGPTAAFKPYLFATMRNLAISWGRSRREVPIEYIEAVEDPTTTEAAADADFDASLVSQAILTLPERWRDVLWFGEVEHLSMQEIGKRLDISERAAAVLAFRAREGLRQAWITAHVSAQPPTSKECRWTLGKLGAHARRRLTPRDNQRIHAHLDECADCRAKAAEARQASSRMLTVLFPAGVAVGAGAQVWGALTSAGISASAAPMPAAVTLPVAGLVTGKASLAVVAAVTAATLGVGIATTLVGEPAVTASSQTTEQLVHRAVPEPTPAPTAVSSPSPEPLPVVDAPDPAPEASVAPDVLEAPAPPAPRRADSYPKTAAPAASARGERSRPARGHRDPDAGLPHRGALDHRQMRGRGRPHGLRLRRHARRGSVPEHRAVAGEPRRQLLSRRVGDRRHPELRAVQHRGSVGHGVGDRDHRRLIPTGARNPRRLSPSSTRPAPPRCPG